MICLRLVSSTGITKYTYRIPSQLNDNICSHKRLPRVRLGGTFSGFVHDTLRGENWHNLVY